MLAGLPQLLSAQGSLSPSFLKGGFARYRILASQFFSFNILNMSSHSPLAREVSAEKSADSFMGVLFCVTFLLSLSIFGVPPAESS